MPAPKLNPGDLVWLKAEDIPITCPSTKLSHK
jgi:hypothetical protein